ncbi:c-type cytochrome [Paraburkholderia terrae]|uniref:c-type cytochrome n=1 Tax=Paraburkholderia terrae TaxID=311230 RepID=UPI002009FC19|nr:c-type cytochrome [Paraburkholderia terrae]BDC39096.1 cytochrome c [Paraburkholderia terrae]
MKSKSYAAFMLAGTLAFTGMARAQAPGLALAQKQNCMSCHSVTRQFMGPPLHDVAAKYAARGDAVVYLTRKIMEGSAGVWGPVPMPANTQVTQDEAMSLASWILTLK